MLRKMTTQLWTVDVPAALQQANCNIVAAGRLLASHPAVIAAAALLKSNEVIGFPTETVYGLGANAWNDEAIAKVFAAKMRPADNPLIVHVCNMDQLHELVGSSLDARAQKLIDAFWPGPLTILFPIHGRPVSKLCSAGQSTVGVRMPNHALALALIEAAGVPIAAPSANRSGKPSPTTAQHVMNDLDGRIAGVLDGGSTHVGLESTVIDVTASVPTILRPGGITMEAIAAILGPVKFDSHLHDAQEAPKAPGMKYTHYAPSAPLYMVDGGHARLLELVKQYQAEGQTVGVLSTLEHRESFPAGTIVRICGSKDNLESVARDLYACLRSFDQSLATIILSEKYSREGFGEAVMNRLEKAAGGKSL